jgi:1-acyl-sn-glycerol-3-phosphate acyltransferase
MNLWLRFKRRLFRGLATLLMRLLARVRVENWEKIRDIQGPVIVASNHLGRVDVALALLVASRDDFIIVVAEKYRENAVFRFLVKTLDLLWLERFEADLGTLKEVFRRLERGGMLLIAPEGTRSTTEALLEAKAGVSYIAAKSGVPVIAASVFGSEDRVVKENLKNWNRSEITIRVGDSFRIPPLPKEGRDLFLREQTDEIMAQIAVLLPDKYRGVYADHPRVRELGPLRV